jgi:branched-chain amino acid transport system ATP-binding protein
MTPKTPPNADEPLLRVVGIDNGYGMSQVLQGLSLSVMPGQCVSLQGRNGMGKTTTIRSIMGIVPVWRGRIFWRGEPIEAEPSHRIARRGVGLVPEGRQIFPNLTVWENLVATARPAVQGTTSTSARTNWTLERVYDLFPRLQERRTNFGNQLSGGEQQMLAIGRALMTNPDLLVLDEATEGLSPLLRQEIWKALHTLREAGISILVTDKNLKALLELCDKHYILEKGCCVWEGDSAAFGQHPELKERYLTA